MGTRHSAAFRLWQPSRAGALPFSGCPAPGSPEPSREDDATLSDLAVVGVGVGPLPFGSVAEITGYALDVPTSLAGVTATPVAISTKATIEMNGSGVDSG